MRYNEQPEKYLSQYSLTIKRIFDDLGYEPIDVIDNIKTNKRCFVYERTNEINFLLCTLKLNKDLSIFPDNETVVEYFKLKKMLPGTQKNDYLSRMKYFDDDFDIRDFIRM